MPDGTATESIGDIGSIRSVDNGDGVVDTSVAYAFIKEPLWTGGSDDQCSNIVSTVCPSSPSPPTQRCCWFNAMAENEGIGLKTFFDPSDPYQSNKQIKFPMQNAVNLGATSILNSFNIATFAPQKLKFKSSTTSCADPSGTNCGETYFSQPRIQTNLFEKLDF